MQKISKTILLSLIIFLFLSSGCIPAAQQEQPPQYRQEAADIKVNKVKGNIYEVKDGGGANCGFYIGQEEVIVIDAKMNKESAKQMIAEIRNLTSLPIKHVILTHSDGDHVNGLVGFPKGINIIANHHTREHMDEAFKTPEQRLYLPEQTFSKKLKLYIGDKVVKFYHFGPAHTNGDVVVSFPDEKVAILGDLLFLGRDPLIHRHKEGSSFGLAKTLKAVLELDADTFVHGHGNVAQKSDVEGVIKSLEEKQLKIKALIEEGKSLEEIKKIFKVEDRPPRPGGRRFLSLVEVIYLELTEKE